MSAIVHTALEDENERRPKRALTQEQREKQEENELAPLLSKLIYLPQYDNDEGLQNHRVKRVNDSPMLNMREHAGRATYELTTKGLKYNLSQI